MKRIISLSLLICVFLRADTPFGLETRPDLQGINFPDTPPIASSYQLVSAFNNLDFRNPIYLTAFPGAVDRIAVVEQRGKIHIFENDPNASSTSTFLDIGNKISSAFGEEGLLGLAFDPDYIQNGYFYVYYTASNPLRGILSRFQVSSNPLAANTTSETKLFEVNQPFSNHNGGGLEFGPDGYLYLSLGDGGSGGDPLGHGQNTSSHLGSLLRIDPSTVPYSIPTDNPFVGVAGFQPEIYAYGLRNVWRFSFDSVTGKLWAADVGQNAFEELNIIEKGKNYGWKTCEGFHAFPPNPSLPRTCTIGELPIHEYAHQGRQSITGGYVYRGTQHPELRGAYIYGDFVDRRVWALIHDGTQVVSNQLIANSSQSIASFGVDANNELFLVGYEGKILKLKPNTATSNNFPEKLSETGLFTDTATLTPNPGLVAYDVALPFWSDNAKKKRFIGVPNGKSVTFDRNGEWQFPVGSVLVKHFELDTVGNANKRLETRVLYHHTTGWAGYTYKWAGQDAQLVKNTINEQHTVQIDPTTVGTQTWTYPNSSQCLSCHTQVSGFVLGVQTKQVNSQHQYPTTTDNQLRTWAHINLLTGMTSAPATLPSYENLGTDLETQARAYLAVNCAQCHQPGAPNPTNMDLRFETPLAQTNLVNVTPISNPTGIVDAKRLMPGNKDKSLLWDRMGRRDSHQMPPLGSNIVDEAGKKLLGQWIDSMTP